MLDVEWVLLIINFDTSPNKFIYLVQGLNRTFTAQPTRHQALRPNTGWNDTHYTISSLRLFRISGRR